MTGNPMRPGDHYPIAWMAAFPSHKVRGYDVVAESRYTFWFQYGIT